MTHANSPNRKQLRLARLEKEKKENDTRLAEKRYYVNECLKEARRKAREARIARARAQQAQYREMQHEKRRRKIMDDFLDYRERVSARLRHPRTPTPLPSDSMVPVCIPNDPVDEESFYFGGIYN
jgi:hypothetical protein